MIRLYTFVLVMWALIILGGGVAVLVLGPLDTQWGFGNSILKGGIAILLVILWVIILIRIRRIIL